MPIAKGLPVFKSISATFRPCFYVVGINFKTVFLSKSAVYTLTTALTKNGIFDVFRVILEFALVVKIRVVFVNPVFDLNQSPRVIKLVDICTHTFRAFAMCFEILLTYPIFHIR